MSEVTLEIDDTTFSAELLPDEAPESVAALRDLLPLESYLLHVRWSGHATWIQVEEGELLDVPRENHTVYPSRGDILLYPGYRNEPEILLACGPTCFKSPAGEIAGNHVAILDASREELVDLEESTLRDGQLPIEIRE